MENLLNILKNEALKIWNNKNKKRLLLFIFSLIILAIILILFVLYKNGKINFAEENKNYDKETNYKIKKNNNNDLLEENQNAKENSEENIIYVHVDGYIKNPGLYKLKSGSRLKNAIDIAGGLKVGANIKEINYASKLEDGEKIYIPSMEQKSTDSLDVSYASEKDKKVNINKADIQELKTLNGIGDSLALAIIKYRKEKGKFKNIEQIKEVNGMGDAKFKKIKEKITI